MQRTRLFLMGFVLALGLGFAAGFGAHAALAPVLGAAPEEAQAPNFGVFWEAWRLARQNYVEADRTDPAHMTYGAIEGMLDSLGDEGHTRFLTPQERQAWTEQLSGQLVGIGVEIALREGRPVVVSPLAGAPAERAGVRAGDIILSVDDHDTAGLTVDALGALIHGPAGSSVRLSVRHTDGDAPLTVTIVRAEIAIPSVTWALAPGTTIAQLRVAQFSDHTHDALVQALTAARAAGATGVILDLRNNPGGLLDEAITTASEFLTGGSIVLVQTRDGQQTADPDRNGDAGADTDLPLIVLINQGSASASEIVAGALKDHGRARLIGEPTFGTGTVLSTYDLSDGSAVVLGTSLWLTPSGQRIKGLGIKPDITVALAADVAPLLPAEVASMTAAALRASSDSQLLRALDELAGSH